MAARQVARKMYDGASLPGGECVSSPSGVSHFAKASCVSRSSILRFCQDPPALPVAADHLDPLAVQTLHSVIVEFLANVPKLDNQSKDRRLCDPGHAHQRSD